MPLNNPRPPPQFSSMLFVPGMAPFDQDRQMGKSRNIRLYVKRVFISGKQLPFPSTASTEGSGRHTPLRVHVAAIGVVSSRAAFQSCLSSRAPAATPSDTQRLVSLAGSRSGLLADEFVEDLMPRYLTQQGLPNC